MIQKEFGWACKKLREASEFSQEKFALLIEKEYFNSKYQEDSGWIWNIGISTIQNNGKGGKEH